MTIITQCTHIWMYVSVFVSLQWKILLINISLFISISFCRHFYFFTHNNKIVMLNFFCHRNIYTLTLNEIFIYFSYEMRMYIWIEFRGKKNYGKNSNNNNNWLVQQKYRHLKIVIMRKTEEKKKTFGKRKQLNYYNFFSIFCFKSFSIFKIVNIVHTRNNRVYRLPYNFIFISFYSHQSVQK